MKTWGKVKDYLYVVSIHRRLYPNSFLRITIGDVVSPDFHKLKDARQYLKDNAARIQETLLIELYDADWTLLTKSDTKFRGKNWASSNTKLDLHYY